MVVDITSTEIQKNILGIGFRAHSRWKMAPINRILWFPPSHSSPAPTHPFLSSNLGGMMRKAFLDISRLLWGEWKKKVDCFLWWQRTTRMRRRKKKNLAKERKFLFCWYSVHSIGTIEHVHWRFVALSYTLPVRVHVPSAFVCTLVSDWIYTNYSDWRVSCMKYSPGRSINPLFLLLLRCRCTTAAHQLVVVGVRGEQQ